MLSITFMLQSHELLNSLCENYLIVQVNELHETLHTTDFCVLKAPAIDIRLLV